MQVIVNGLLTHYEVSGSGKPVVLLHGWGDNISSLRNLAHELSKGYKVIALDLPGFGTSAAPKEVWGLSDFAQHIAGFLKKLNIDTPYALIGHSNGGAIAIRGLGSGTLRADNLVLLAAAGVREVKRPAVKHLVVRAGKLLLKPLPKKYQQALRKKVYQQIGSDMFVAEHMQETFKKVVADDVRVDAAKLSLPTLLMYGEADTATPVAYGELFHELITGSTLEVLPGAGHFVFLDRPHEVTHAIKDFLR